MPSPLTNSSPARVPVASAPLSTPHEDKASGGENEIEAAEEALSAGACSPDAVAGAKSRDKLSLFLAPLLVERDDSKRGPVPQIAWPLGGTALVPAVIPREPQRLLLPTFTSPFDRAAEFAEGDDVFALPAPTAPVPTSPITPHEAPKALPLSGSPRLPLPPFSGDERNTGLLLVTKVGRGDVTCDIAPPVIPPAPAPDRLSDVSLLLDDKVGGLAGEIFVGTKTRAAAESSPFCNASVISVDEPGESDTGGGERDGLLDGSVTGARGVLVASIKEPITPAAVAGSAGGIDDAEICRWR